MVVLVNFLADKVIYPPDYVNFTALLIRLIITYINRF